MISLGWRLALRGWKRMMLVSVGLAVALLFYGYYQLTLAQIAGGAVDMVASRSFPGDTLVMFTRNVSPKEYSTDFDPLTGLRSKLTISRSKLRLDWDGNGATLLTLDVQNSALELAKAVQTGRLPESSDEVCLTDEAATVWGLSLGDRLEMEGEYSLLIVGLLRADAPLPIPPSVDGLTLFTHGVSLEKISYVFLFAEEGKTDELSRQLRAKYAQRRDVALSDLRSAEGGDTQSSTLAGGLVGSMSTLLVFSVGAFLANMQLVGLMNKRKETQALKAVGLSLGQMFLFPVMDALWAAVVAVPFFILGWQFVLPRFVTEAVGLSDPLVIRTLMLGVGVCLAAGVLAGAVNSRGQFGD